jgi:beta-galactosidase
LRGKALATNYIPFPAVFHGGDYNPEQWPENIWDDDVRLMQEAHVNIATLPVFGWASLQPDEDTWTFDWLDRIIEKLHAGGIRVCMATATASTPAWLDQKYEDVRRVGQNGQRLRHGGRHSFCPNSPNFRRLSTGLVRKLAERYGQHPALAIWHIGNEYGNICYCNLCEAAFRVWLQARYGSLEELNRRWYTRFWGHTYTDWSQVEAPTQQRILQGLLIDYDRFQSESLLGCFKAEAEVLRELSSNIPITTNLMGAFKPLDYHQWAKEMDIVSWDSYPRKGAQPHEMAFNHALMRGLKEGQPWLLMEQTPSQQNWQAQNALKRPGIMRLWSYQAMAHGADSIMYFQWRRGQGGIEKFHGAIVEHEGSSRPRVFQEVAQLGRELEKLGTQTIGARVPAEAAILFDWNNWWALEYSSGPTVDLKYVAQCQKYFGALHNNHISTDVISPEADFSPYKVLVAPAFYMVKPGIAEKIEAFVQNGGTFITTFMSGIVDETDLVHLGGYPGPLRKLLGIWAEEIDALMPNETNQVLWSQPLSGLTGISVCSLLCDRIHAEGAQVLATYASDFYSGEPAVTVNQLGSGRAYYLATDLEKSALNALVKHICNEAKVLSPLPHTPDGVEVMPRLTPQGQTQLYVLNHNAESVIVILPEGKFRDLLTDEISIGQSELPRFGVRILQAV